MKKREKNHETKTKWDDVKHSLISAISEHKVTAAAAASSIVVIGGLTFVIKHRRNAAGDDASVFDGVYENVSNKEV